MNTFEHATQIIADRLGVPLHQAALAAKALVDARVIASLDPADPDDLADIRGSLRPPFR